MSKISIKTAFADGEKLFAQQLNNNFLVIQAGINANEENLQQVIDQAVIELDNELEEITANRGWDWNGGDRVTFFKGNTSQVNAQEIKDGQLLYNTDSGETALDDDGERIVTGSGNVVSISENEPTNPSTKIWIKPSKIVRYAASYVTNNMSGEDTDKAPSVKAAKDYVDSVYDSLIKITEMGTVSSDIMTPTTIGGHNGKRYDLTFTKQYDTPPMVITNVYHNANYGSYGIAPVNATNITTTGCRLLLEADVSLSNYGVKYIVISND